MVQAVSPEAYRAARQASAFVDRTGSRGLLVVSGADRASYLHGLFTNDIAALAPGTGCYAAYLTPQGRMIADLWVYELGDAIFLVVPRAVKDVVLSKLDQFIFSEDVRLGDVSDTFAELAVIGPDAARVLGEVLPGAADGEMPLHANRRADFHGHAAIVVRADDAGERGFGVFVERAAAGRLGDVLVAAGCEPLDAATAEAIRIEGGVPLFGRDMDQETIPLEAGLESRAISFTKGCYVGQEVIVRVLHRGHGRVARRLVGILVEGTEPPAAGATVVSGDREIGVVTSATMSPAVQRPIALAYVQRDFVEPGTKVTVGSVPAIVTALPFVSAS